MPKVYVGTYAKYNAGDLRGAWLDLENYANKEEFLEACRELHNDEVDPEFMFQDWEGIPKVMISESHIDEALWDWMELDDEERELLAVYRDHVDANGTIEQAREAFLGKASSKVEFAEQYYEDTGMLGGCPEHLRHYISWHAVVRDMEYDWDFVYVDGEYWVFSR
ncbi:antirestriction protein ArdA [Candidatus Saccharibacteria bacterium]|nr:antirestriction protein ArdA [Candidatus Saccharibacteria bacterium]